MNENCQENMLQYQPFILSAIFSVSSSLRACSYAVPISCRFVSFRIFVLTCFRDRIAFLRIKL